MGWTFRGSNPDGGETFRTCPNRPCDPPSFLYNGYRVFPRDKERPGRDANPSPPSSAVGHERVEVYLYSPYGPYGLYRASVSVQEDPCIIVKFIKKNPTRCSSVSEFIIPYFYEAQRVSGYTPSIIRSLKLH